MNAFLNPRTGTRLTNIVDVTAHSISLFQENEQPTISIKYLYLKQVFQYQNL